MASDSVPFASLLKNIVDNRGKTCPIAESGIPLIATNCVKNELLYPSYESVRFVDEHTYATWFRGHPLPGDFLFVTKGSPGRVAVVPDPVDFCIAQDMVAIRADREKVYPLYLFALLRSREVQERIEQLHVGTMIPHFKKGDFDKLLLAVPDRRIQEFIGNCYFAFSSKIDLNRKINETLEAMARALFKSWFVDFDPVRAKAEGRDTGLPEFIAALFPDSFAESELGSIPTGWTVRQLGEVSSYLSRGISPSYIEDGGVLVLNQKCIRNGEVDTSKGRRHDSSKRSIDGRTLQFGDILVNSTGVGTLGRVAQFLQVNDEAIVDSHVTVVRTDGAELSEHFLGVTLGQRQAEIGALGEGSTGQTELSRYKLAEILVLVPSRPIIDQFDRLCAPLRQARITNGRESISLASLRDALLPKLLSGEIKIKPSQSVDSQQEEAANERSAKA